MGESTVYSNAFRNANGGTENGARDALLAAFTGGNAYLNIHIDAFTGGEIRAQIVPVPEPAAWLLMALGLTGVMLRARQRHAVDTVTEVPGA